MSVVKLPSGSYRVQKMINGKRYGITLDHKPSKAEVQEIVSDFINKSDAISYGKKTFSGAYNKYIEVKYNILSPATIRGYNSCFKNIPDYFKNMLLNDITSIEVQKVINDYSKGHSPKSVRNMSGLISSVLRMNKPELVVNIKLPPKKRTKAYVPTNEDVERILDYVSGGKYEIPIRLATYGLRRGEICALSINDLNGNVLQINKDVIQNEKYEWVVKDTPKTEESNRKITLDDYTAELIRKRGYVFEGHPEMISRELNRVQDKLEIPHFSIHKLRHYFASVTHEMGISDADIMAMGGWKTDHVMKRVYREAQEDSVSIGMRRFADRMNKTD